MAQRIDDKTLINQAYVLAILYLQSNISAPNKIEFTSKELEELRTDKKIVVRIDVERI